ERRLAQAIAQAAFASELLERLPAEVSEGQLARAMLARAIIAEPRYLVCDEPTASVDSATAQTVRRTLTEIAASGVGVLVVSHHETELVNWADRVLRLGHGAVTQADR
ncbi:MAG: ATP-binding cassette domain-containing protein, partial [Brooklawnia sp.]|nr:ATP-binding cassette domain-containing protein [Brooklawnia sp.]